MKVILIHNKYQQAGGEDVVFQSEAELLIAHGHEVELMIFDNKEIKTAVDKIFSGIKVIYNPSSRKKLENKIKEFRPQIIHVHNFVPLASPSIFFAAKKFDIPVVVTLHNYRLICPSATLFFNHSIYEKSLHAIFPWDAIAKGVYRNSRLQTAGLAIATRLHNVLGTWENKVDKFIVLTQFARDKFNASILRTAKNAFVVKPNFVVDFGNGLVKRDNFFLFIGRLTEEKGIDTLLESTKLYGYKVFIIGDGPMRSKVEDFAKSNANLCYLGFQPKPVIIEYLKKCKALIFPSTWYEGFPMTILEAFSSGTPVIASRLGSMEEIVEDGVNGMHFEAGNPHELASKIKRLEAEPDLVTELSKNARSTYLNLYTPDKNYLLLFDIYSRVLSRKRVTV